MLFLRQYQTSIVAMVTKRTAPSTVPTMIVGLILRCSRELDNGVEFGEGDGDVDRLMVEVGTRAGG